MCGRYGSNLTTRINAAIAEHEARRTPEEAAEDERAAAWRREAARRTSERVARDEADARLNRGRDPEGSADLEDTVCLWDPVTERDQPGVEAIVR